MANSAFIVVAWGVNSVDAALQPIGGTSSTQALLQNHDVPIVNLPQPNHDMFGDPEKKTNPNKGNGYNVVTAAACNLKPPYQASWSTPNEQQEAGKKKQGKSPAAIKKPLPLLDDVLGWVKEHFLAEKLTDKVDKLDTALNQFRSPEHQVLAKSSGKDQSPVVLPKKSSKPMQGELENDKLARSTGRDLAQFLTNLVLALLGFLQSPKVQSMLKQFGEASEELREMLKKFGEVLPKVGKCLEDLWNCLFTKLKSVAKNLLESAPSVADLTNIIAEGMKQILTFIWNLLNGGQEWLKNSAEQMKDAWLKGLPEGLQKNIRNFDEQKIKPLQKKHETNLQKLEAKYANEPAPAESKDAALKKVYLEFAEELKKSQAAFKPLAEKVENHLRTQQKPAEQVDSSSKSKPVVVPTPTSSGNKAVEPTEEDKKSCFGEMKTILWNNVKEIHDLFPSDESKDSLKQLKADFDKTNYEDFSW